MNVISHRGFWHKKSEKNTPISFERSFAHDFGTETDIRDCNGRLVISHDMPNETAISVESFFGMYRRYNKNLPLALNIKADGMQAELLRLLAAYDIENYFVFDMAVPDGLIYCRDQFKVYTRQSEYEPVPPFYNLAQGVWLDEFNGHWLTNEIIENHLSNDKQLCIVSPDLHKRDYRKEWEHYKRIESQIGKDKLMLCTDFPDQAREFFNG